MRVCLYGAGSKNISEKYLNEGYILGEMLSDNGHSLVFGAGSNGMMSAVSSGFRDNNGYILGISTVFMNEFEEVCDYCNDLIYAKSMDERKVLFIENSDCFIISPGGVGTLDEFFEVLTLKHLNRINNPIIIFNIDGYYNPLISMLNNMISEGFIIEDIMDLIFVSSSVDEIIDYLDGL